MYTKVYNYCKKDFQKQCCYRIEMHNHYNGGITMFKGSYFINLRTLGWSLFNTYIQTFERFCGQVVRFSVKKTNKFLNVCFGIWLYFFSKSNCIRNVLSDEHNFIIFISVIIYVICFNPAFRQWNESLGSPVWIIYYETGNFCMYPLFSRIQCFCQTKKHKN